MSECSSLHVNKNSNQEICCPGDEGSAAELLSVNINAAYRAGISNLQYVIYKVPALQCTVEVVVLRAETSSGPECRNLMLKPL